MSLQSGNDQTLKDMNRKYTTEFYMSRVDLIRKYYPRAAITTDLICGFPTETEEQFAGTLEFIDKVAFSDMHILHIQKGRELRQLNIKCFVVMLSKIVQNKLSILR